MAKSFAVLGMGRFGRSVAENLAASGAAVMVVDKAPEAVNQCASFATQALVADLSDEEAVKSLALENMDAVVISFAMDLETTILCILIAKEAGVPLIVAKARNRRMGAILEKVGADKIVYPEEETGNRFAKSLISQNFIDYYNLSDDVCLLEMKIRQDWVGKSLIELNLRQSMNVNIIAIKKDGVISHVIDPHAKLDENIVLFVITSQVDANRLL